MTGQLVAADRGPGNGSSPRSRGKLVLAAGTGAATELAGLGLLATATWLLARAAERPPIVALTVAIVAVRGLAIARGTLRYVERLAGHDAALGVLARLRTRVYAQLSARPSGLPRGDLLARLVSDVDGVQDLLLRCAIPAAVGAVVSALAIGFTALFHPLAALVLAAGLVLAGLVLPWLGYRSAARSGSRIAAARGRYLAASVDVLAGAADLAAYGATGAALDRAADGAGAVARLERRAGAVGSAVGAVGSLLPGLTAVGVCLLTLHSGPSVMVAVLSLLALGAVEAVLPLSGAAVRYAELRGAWERVRALLREPVPEDGPVPVAEPTAIRLDRVTVRYPGSRTPALDGVDLDLPPGRRVAVVGPSGAGKSTLLGVLSGTVPADTGVVLGWPLVGGVLADGYVFHATIRENLTLGRPLDDAALGRALDVAGLPGWAARLDEPVGEDGGRLSGGERQRLLLARALAAPPPVLLLDEPTEGLDPAAADDVLAGVLRACAGHTVVLVTHRLVDLRGFDEILVLDEGRVVARGGHDALLAAGGWYADWAGVPTGGAVWDIG